jgi:ribose/xylose/arabinose/galactoside ABC-type transport system permease subunit
MTEPSTAPAPPPERDRLVINLVWEAFLALAAIGATVALFATNERLTFTSYLEIVAPVGLVAAAVAVSLRAGAPNLAVGAIASLTGCVGAQLATEEDFPIAVAMAVAVLIGIVASVIIAVITAALAVPTWIATLGFALIINVALLDAFGGRGVLLRGDPGSTGGVIWFLLFLFISIGGGVLWWLVPGVRRMLSAAREPSLPGRWPGLRAAVSTVIGLTLSGLIASLAGVAYALVRSFVTPDNGALTYLGFAAALLGGASIFGRRAGLAGTFLAVLLLQAVTTLIAIEDADSVVDGLLPGIAIIIGLGIGRAIEAVNNSMNPRRQLVVLTADPPVGGAPTVGGR